MKRLTGLTLAFSAMLIGAVAAFQAPAANAAVQVEWGNAPLACLPNRAEKWEEQSEMKPCHCPPKSMCPDGGAGIRRSDVQLIATIQKIGNGPDLNVLDGFNWENMGSNVTIITLTGAQLNGINVHEAMTTYDDHRLAGLFGITNFSGNFWQIEVSLRMYDETVQDQQLGTGDVMPPELAAVCCDSLCPAGFIPQPVVVRVPPAVVQPPVIDPGDIGNPGFRGRDGLLFDQLVLNRILDTFALVTPAYATGTDVEAVTCEVTETVLTRTIMREGCILEGTPVTLADGSAKAIEALKLGDVLKGQKGNVTIKAINKFTQNKDDVYGINGGAPFISMEHPVLTTAGWKSISPEMTSVKSDIKVVGQLKVGDEIVTKDGTLKVATIDKHTKADGATVYNLSVDGEGAFVANDVVVRGLNQVQIHY